jgi:hypothetical protein
MHIQRFTLPIDLGVSSQEGTSRNFFLAAHGILAVDHLLVFASMSQLPRLTVSKRVTAGCGN